MQRGNDGAIRERQSAVAVGLDRKIVAQFGAQLLELASPTGQLLARQSLDGDQAPIVISVGDFNSIDRRSLSIGLSGCGLHVGGDTGDCSNGTGNGNQSYPSHNLLLVRSHQTGFVTSMTASAKTLGDCCGRAWPAFGTRWWIRLPENLAAEDRPSLAGMIEFASPSSVTVGTVMTGRAASFASTSAYCG